MSSAKRGNAVPPLELDKVGAGGGHGTPLQIIVDGTHDMIGSPVPQPEVSPQGEDEDNSRSVSPCPSITVDACEGELPCKAQGEGEEGAEEEQRAESPHMLSLPKRRHSDVSQSAVTYYKSSLLGSRSENVLFTFHNSLDISPSSSRSAMLDLPRSKNTQDGRVVAALCSPETHRKQNKLHNRQGTSAKQDTS